MQNGDFCTRRSAIKLQSADAKSIFSLARPPRQRHKNRNRSRAACRFFVNYFRRVRRVISREFALRLLPREHKI